jgi:hypothetical protein
LQVDGILARRLLLFIGEFSVLNEPIKSIEQRRKNANYAAKISVLGFGGT